MNISMNLAPSPCPSPPRRGRGWRSRVRGIRWDSRCQSVRPSRWTLSWNRLAFGLALLLLLTATAPLQAQVTVGLQMAQDQFLPGEAIPISLRITNFSGQTLRLGADPLWLEFFIESEDGYLVPRTGQLPASEPFNLETSTIATKRADLAPLFPVLKAGRYSLTATVRVPQWQTDLTTSPQKFGVINGTVLWEQSFGVPPPGGAQSPPEFRKYALQQAIHLKQNKLYVRVTDQTGDRVYGIFPLGPMLTFSTPEKQIDQNSILHVLYQYGARSFYYYTINPEGQLVRRQTHDYYGASRPVLRIDQSGKVLVHGGVRRPARDDFPPATNQPPAVVVAPTNNPPPR